MARKVLRYNHTLPPQLVERVRALVGKQGMSKLMMELLEGWVKKRGVKGKRAES